MDQEFVIDMTLLLMQIEELNVKVYELCETYRSRLANESNTGGEMLQLVLEGQTEQAPKRKRNITKPRHSWTEEEDALVLALVARGCEYPEIVRVLKIDVTPSAVGNRYLRVKAVSS